MQAALNDRSKRRGLGRACRAYQSDLQLVMGPLHDTSRWAPLDVEVVSEEKMEKLSAPKIRFTPEVGDRVPAWLLVPMIAGHGKAPAMLCLHQTTKIGKDEPAGLGGCLLFIMRMNWPRAAMFAWCRTIHLLANIRMISKHKAPTASVAP